MYRRRFLHTAGLLLAQAPILGACLRPGTVRTGPGRVLVSEQRILRHLAGLRPYRAEGFRIEHERLAERDIIHNYGHGGAGVTLSWGSADEVLAILQAMQPSSRQVAVVGCGVLGLTTARRLQQTGWRVTIYADKLPPNTTSNVAGALWAATTVADPAAHDPRFPDRLKKIARNSYARFTGMAGPGYGVRFMDLYRVGNGPPPDQPWPWELMLTPELFPLTKQLEREQNPFGTDYGRVYRALYIDPDRFLSRLTADFRAGGGTIHSRRFEDLPSLLSLQEQTIINCTGLGSYHLFEDHSLIPVKGQLVELLPQEDVDYILFSPAGYLMRRSRSIILGGSHEEGNWDNAADKNVSDRIIRQHRDFFNSY